VKTSASRQLAPRDANCGFAARFERARAIASAELSIETVSRAPPASAASVKPPV